MRNEFGRKVFGVFEQVKQNFLDANLDGLFKALLVVLNVEDLVFWEEEAARSENISFAWHLSDFLFAVDLLCEAERCRVESKGKQVLFLPLLDVEVDFRSLERGLSRDLLGGRLRWLFLPFSQVQLLSRFLPLLVDLLGFFMELLHSVAQILFLLLSPASQAIDQVLGVIDGAFLLSSD